MLAIVTLATALSVLAGCGATATVSKSPATTVTATGASSSATSTAPQGVALFPASSGGRLGYIDTTGKVVWEDVVR